MPDDAATTIAGAVGELLDRPVASVHRLTTGHSRAMYVAETADGERFVVRVEQGGVFGTSSEEERRVMAGLRAQGLPVAEIVASEATGELIGFPFFVMRFVPGDPEPAGGTRTVAPTVVDDFVRVLTRLHDADGGAIDFEVRPERPDDATPGQVERWYRIHLGAVDHAVPLLDEARAWLLHHAPPLDHLAVVHGDAGPGNFVTADGAVAALTDFEFCHLGDPAEDWVFCATMRGRTTMTRDEWADVFDRVAGVSLDAVDWHYWEAFNLFKGACANLTGLRVVADGVRPAPNLYIVGTTIHRMFLRQLADLTAGPPGAG